MSENKFAEEDTTDEGSDSGPKRKEAVVSTELTASLSERYSEHQI